MHAPILDASGLGKLLQHIRRERIRDVRQGPDGAIYLLADRQQGRLLEVLPKRRPT
jgi:glucose/arabinose dehydrogenase